MTMFGSPLLLGFESFERVLDRLSKTADGYPPYNIEEHRDGRLRITIAVAGFSADDLSVSLEDRLLVVRGRRQDEPERNYIHRGIAARQFQRSFLIADGIEVTKAWFDNGLLRIELARPRPAAEVRTIPIERGLQREASRLEAVVGGDRS